MPQKIINHPEYEVNLEYYRQIRVFVKGRKDTQRYLLPVTTDADVAGKTRNENYKKRAKYTNFPARTRNALAGAVFRKDAKLEVPDKLEYIKENANGAGKPLDQVAKNTVTNVIEVGRHGVFTDYGTQAKIVTYTAENIPNWSTDDEGNLISVTLITGENTHKILTLINDEYVVEMYEDDELINMILPTKADGSTFDEIPFTFCGSVDNSPDVDDMPLWSIVDVTQGHYQNSADYEDILTYMLPTPAVTAPNAQWVKEMLPNGVYEFGNGGVIPLPDGGTATLLQAEANQMHAEAMKDKENQLIMLGARLVSGGGQAETAEAVRIKFSAENGVLDNLVGNVTGAMLKALQWAAEFEGVNPDGIEYTLNREFWDVTISPQQISAEILLLDRGIKAKKDVRDTLRKTGGIAADRDDEDIDSDILNEGSGLE